MPVLFFSPFVCFWFWFFFIFFWTIIICIITSQKINFLYTVHFVLDTRYISVIVIYIYIYNHQNRVYILLLLCIYFKETIFVLYTACVLVFTICLAAIVTLLIKYKTHNALCLTNTFILFLFITLYISIESQKMFCDCRRKAHLGIETVKYMAFSLLQCTQSPVQ